MQSWRSNLNRRFEGLLHWRLLGEESNFVWFISLKYLSSYFYQLQQCWRQVDSVFCSCMTLNTFVCMSLCSDSTMVLYWSVIIFLHIVFQGRNSWPSLGLTYGWSLWCSSGSTIFSFVCLFKAPVISLLWIEWSCSSMCFEWIKVSLALMSLCSCFPVNPGVAKECHSWQIHSPDSVKLANSCWKSLAKNSPITLTYLSSNSSNPLGRPDQWLLLVPPRNFFQVRPFSYILKLPLKSQTPQHLTQLRLIHGNPCVYIKAFTVFVIIFKTTGTAPKSTGNGFK